MTAYYNEIDPYAAEWLRNLIAGGHIAPGDVDERSIEDVRPDDLAGYDQCHFFAGIGAWSYALRLAGWPDDKPVWTGSCPCQPFSAAGKRGGTADERHLWPAWHHLIRVCRPPVVYGEQVASKDGLGWLDLVQADMEGENYACGPVDLCAAGFGAPHWRQRLWFAAYDLRLADAGMVDADHVGSQGRVERGYGAGQFAVGSRGMAGGVADDTSDGQHEERADSGGRGPGNSAQGRSTGPDTGGATGGMADAACQRPDGQHALLRPEAPGRIAAEIPQIAGGGETGKPGPVNGFWRDADWIFCRDGKWRPVEPGTFPLADGAPARVGRLRAYGNAISPWAAKAVIEA